MTPVPALLGKPAVAPAEQARGERPEARGTTLATNVRRSDANSPSLRFGLVLLRRVARGAAPGGRCQEPPSTTCTALDRRRLGGSRHRRRNDSSPRRASSTLAESRRSTCRSRWPGGTGLRTIHQETTTIGRTTQRAAIGVDRQLSDIGSAKRPAQASILGAGWLGVQDI